MQVILIGLNTSSPGAVKALRHPIQRYDGFVRPTAGGALPVSQGVFHKTRFLLPKPAAGAQLENNSGPSGSIGKQLYHHTASPSVLTAARHM
jgi:hypothetical protein